MPEGPSIVILKEAILQFKGRKVLEVSGYAKEDIGRLKNKVIKDIRSWGKHTLIMFSGLTVRIHLMMFGSYRVNEVKKTNPKLHMGFSDDEQLNFYACDIKLIEGDINDEYDWSGDIMNPKWSSAKAVKKLKEHPDMLACDALMDQDIVAGSGNIIKNEVLWLCKLHPLSEVGALTPKQMKKLMDETSSYAFDFLEWKKKGTLKKNWNVYTKKKCPRCDVALKKQYLGKTKRRTFFCEHCQVLHER